MLQVSSVALIEMQSANVSKAGKWAVDDLVSFLLQNIIRKLNLYRSPPTVIKASESHPAFPMDSIYSGLS